MSTWQIFSDAGNNFRWEISVPQLQIKSEDESNGALIQPNSNSSSRLPSMADLLLEGCSKLLENHDFNDGSSPMFRTGWGKSVGVKESSIEKALSVLGEDASIDTGCSKLLENRDFNDGSSPMFRTGWGKSVGVKETSIEKALSVLGEDASIDIGCSKLLENRDFNNGRSPMFRTGWGNSVGVKESSMAKALSVLGEDASIDTGCQKNCDFNNGTSPMFRTGSGKSVGVKDSSIAKALSVLGEGASIDTGQVNSGGNGCGFSNSLFQTGSGKAVNVSSTGLIRAKTLLGLEEDNEYCTLQGAEGTRTPSTTNKPHGWQSLSHLERREGVNNGAIIDVPSVPRPLLVSKTGLVGSELNTEASPGLVQSDTHNSSLKPPPIKFHTAGGRSISVSTSALQRARSLLGDPGLGSLLTEGDADDWGFSFLKEKQFDNPLSSKENDPRTFFSHQETAKNKHTSKSFTSPLRSSSNHLLASGRSEIINSGTNLIKKFDEVDNENACALNSNIPCLQKPLSTGLCKPDIVIDNSLTNDIGSRSNPHGRPSRRPLIDISNSTSTFYTISTKTTSEKRKLVGRSSISPFKRPRSYKFSTPLNKNVSFVPNGLSTLSSENSCCKRRVSTRYPFPVPRMYIKEYLGVPQLDKNMLKHLSVEVRSMKPNNVEKYRFRDESSLNCIGAEAFLHMLARAGASMQYASKEWVSNHYKSIVWKLACYERCYPAKFAGKFVTVTNVLEELKYRYEREVNHGNRSAIKRILEGDASPSSMMVVCISAIHSNGVQKIESSPLALNETENHNAAKVELTDGWYSVDAILDVLLSKQLAAGKLFVGQKLRIWGAGLCGWVGPVSPLEASRTVYLLLHINGTYRAHWADRMGFCKGVGAPLAFGCIKSNGGPVPLTLLGVTRIYPVLYKEKLRDGGSVVRSERLETKIIQAYNQRRSIVLEGITSEFQRGAKVSHIYNDSDSEEGAKILKILETAAEPEVLMAEMSSKQLTSFTNYQAKLEAIRQFDAEKSIKKALEDAGLSEREVTPFMRIRVVGLTSNNYQGKGSPKEGLITIWNPTGNQQYELVEGQAYAISGLVPSNSDSDTLYLQARGATTKWQPLSPSATEHYRPFFRPRQSILLSALGEVPFSSEFDIAAYVVYVGEVYTTAHQKKQWVFVTDGSVSELQLEELSNSLLAISFCSPYVADDSFSPINYNLAGSTVGFCNLIKRAKDQMNHIWVAEATENSTYYFSRDPPHCSHLKNAANSAQQWATISGSTIEKLREKVLFIIGDCKG